MEYSIADELLCRSAPSETSRFAHFNEHATRKNDESKRSRTTIHLFMSDAPWQHGNLILERRPAVGEMPEESFGLSRYRGAPMKLYSALSFPSSSAVAVVLNSLNSDASLQPNAVFPWRDLRGCLV